MSDVQATEQAAPQDPAALYAQLTPEQRAAFAQEFIQKFQQSDNPKSQQLASVDAQKATPEQVAAMHEHASQAHPGFLEELVQHPVASAAISGLAVYGIERYFKSKEKQG